VRRSFPRVVLVLASTLGLGACGALLDLQALDFAGSGTDGGPTEASSADGVSSDAPRVDGGPTDAGPDAHDLCSDGKKHDFCDDFEGVVGNIEDRWGKHIELQGFGKVSLEVTDGAPSPVTVFRSSIDYGLDGGMVVESARLSKQDSPWPRADSGAQPAVRMAFEVLLETIDVSPYQAALGGVTIGRTPTFEDFLTLYAVNDGGGSANLQLYEVYEGDAGVEYSVKTVAAKIPLGVWTSIELLIQEREVGQNGGVVLYVGGAPQSFALASGSRVPYFRADLGLSVGTYQGSHSAALFDNVRIDYLP
jgi:hypothetical protein